MRLGTVRWLLMTAEVLGKDDVLEGVPVLVVMAVVVVAAATTVVVVVEVIEVAVVVVIVDVFVCECSVHAGV